MKQFILGMYYFFTSIKLVFHPQLRRFLIAPILISNLLIFLLSYFANDYIQKIENLYLIGRNGMHKYNNQDHSMLTAMEAVNNIINNRTDKENIWDVNTEQDYHETKK